MSRHQATLVLAACLVVLAALGGLAGYRAYSKYYLPMTRPHPVPAATPRFAPTIDVSDSPSGDVVEFTIENLSTDEVTKVSITSFSCGGIKAPGLPAVVTHLAGKSSKTLRIRVPGLKTARSGYKEVTYTWDWSWGSGTGSYSSGTPPVKTVATPKTKHHRRKARSGY